MLRHCDSGMKIRCDVLKRVQRHTIVCQSGMEDYVSVTIDCTESFSFDFWTKELTCEYGNRYFDDVSEAFRKVYGNITIINNSK